jgi:hypothetical protein
MQRLTRQQQTSIRHTLSAGVMSLVTRVAVLLGRRSCARAHNVPATCIFLQGGQYQAGEAAAKPRARFPLLFTAI